MAPPSPLARLKSILEIKKDTAQKAVLITQLAPLLPFTNTVSDILDKALRTADPLLQVAIMDAWFEIAGDKYYESDLEAILLQAAQLRDEGEQLYMATRAALGRINGQPQDSLDMTGDGELVIAATAIRRAPAGVAGRRAAAPVLPNEITVIIHGTWAADGEWWRPNGDYFEYVKTDLGRDVYGKSDQFKWSGKNREGARQKAGVELHKWLKGRAARHVNVFAHSHGANVAMLATRQGIQMDRLVMLSPPVRKDYFADWSKVGNAYNIQASFDPVVAIARGGSSFAAEGVHVVKEKSLKASGHSSSHDPEVWRSENLGDFIDIHAWP